MVPPAAGALGALGAPLVAGADGSFVEVLLGAPVGDGAPDGLVLGDSLAAVLGDAGALVMTEYDGVDGSGDSSAVGVCSPQAASRAVAVTARVASAGAVRMRASPCGVGR